MSSLLAAPPLTYDSVINVLDGVNWRTLCDGLYSDGGIFRYGRLVRITPASIQAKHQSDEACLKALVENFLADDDRSWRKLIWALYKSHHVHHAEKIRSYAEPLKGVLSWDTM